MRPGSVVLARVQQADGQMKPRPMIVLQTMPPFSDFLVVVLSSQLRHEVAGFDDVIDRESSDFSASGLKQASLVRLGLLSTVPNSDLEGKLGEISKQRLERLRNRLAQHIKA